MSAPTASAPVVLEEVPLMHPRTPASGPQLGLVCITHGDAVRYRTVTRTRYLALESDEARYGKLLELYSHNLEVLFGALEFCRQGAIGLYRVTSDLFPMADLGDGIGQAVLATLRPRMAEFGPRSLSLGVRVVIHPDQFVVLNSESPRIVRSSIRALWFHAFVLDLLGLPRSSWTVMNIHGGKGGRSRQLIETVRELPENIRSRLTFENDEYTYSARDILHICQEAGVPFVYDVHHHTVHAKLESPQHPHILEMVRLARSTWPIPDWQLVHLSSGKQGTHDAKHHELILEFPDAFREVGYVEVEAKTKEHAIADLRAQLAGVPSPISLEALLAPPPRKRVKKAEALPEEGAEDRPESSPTPPAQPARRKPRGSQAPQEVASEV